MLYRLTKSLTVDGEYRMQTRAAIYFVKSLYKVILFIFSTAIFILYPQWFQEHFIDLKADSTDFLPLLHVSATLVGFYSWEVITNRYAKLYWSVIVHHWATAAIALSILMGRYTPFAVWYGFTEVSMLFPVFFMLGFRAQYSFRYPVFTRKGLVFARWWMVFTLILNFSGQMFIITNSLMYHFNESIPISMICIMFVAILCWLYDDINLLRSLHTFSQQDYEEADFLSTAKDSVVNVHVCCVPFHILYWLPMDFM